MKLPKCKCGKPCAYYGKIGGFSKGCADCNAAKALNAKQSRKRIKLGVEMIPFFDVNGKVVFALPATMTMKDMIELGIPIPRLVPKEITQKENELRA